MKYSKNEMLDILDKEMTVLEFGSRKSRLFKHKAEAEPKKEVDPKELVQPMTKKRKYHPVFIVLTQYKSPIEKPIEVITKSKWSHACISLSPELSALYSYNGSPNKVMNGSAKGGFSRESLSEYKKRMPDNQLKVIATFLTAEEYEVFRNRINYLIKNNDKTSYSWKGLLNVITKKEDNSKTDSMICSQFVDSMYKLIDANISDKASNLVTPGDLGKLRSKKLYSIYTGKIKDYNPEKAKRTVLSLTKSKNTKLLTEETIDGYIYVDATELFNE